MQNAKSILFVEPSCFGYEHVPFNAALIKALAKCFKGMRMFRVGEASHLKCLSIFIEKHFHPESDHCDNFNIELHYFERHAPSFASQILAIVRSLLLIRRAAISNHPDLLVFSSISSKYYSIIRFAHLIFLPRIPCLIIFHHAFHDIRQRPTNIIRRWFSLRYQLNRGCPKQFKLFVLGQSIAQNAVKYLVSAEKKILYSIDHPYLMPTSNEVDILARLSKCLTFAYVGIARSGFDGFCKIAESLSYSNKCRFIHIGKGSHNDITLARKSGVLGTSVEALTRVEMEALLKETTYLVGTAPPELYELSASGTFLDGLASGIPGIYLRNDYVSYYFHKLGDIGYICDSLDEIIGLILRLANKFDVLNYRHQIDNIILGRSLFEPASVAEELRDIIESI